MAPHILLLGATGVSGLAFIKYTQSLPDAPRLTLFVRNAAKLPQDILQADGGGRITIVQAALTDTAALDRAMQGVDGVVSVLGAYISLYYLVTRARPTPLADAFKRVVACMKRHGVKRLLTLSTPAHKLEGESYTWFQWFNLVVMPTAITPQGSAEMTALADVSRDPALEWTIFRVPMLTNGAADKPVHAGLLDGAYTGGGTLTRESMAKWVYEEILEPKWVHQEPALAN